MRIWDALKDATRRKKGRSFAQELSNQFFHSALCSDYENLFAQVRPLIDEMKCVVPYGVTDIGKRLNENKTPELAWLKNPNDDMGWAEFADLMFATWLTEDELDIHVWKDGRDKVIGYTVLPPETRVYLGYGQWQWQVYSINGEFENLTEEDVMRIRFSRSPRDIQRGVSPASAVRIWAQIDDLIGQYEKAYFENGAVPATITFITASTEEKYRATRRELESKLKGARNRNKTVYAWRQFNNDDGSSVDQIEVKTIQGNNSTMAIKEIVEIVNDKLNKSIGVSNFILGDDSSAKYDNAELSDHQFTKRRVYPALVSFWNQFQHELDRITGGLGYAISFDLEIPELTERTKAKAEIARVQSESLIKLIESGSGPLDAVKALELPEEWNAVAMGIYSKSLTAEVPEAVVVDAMPKAIEATVDEAPKSKKVDAVELLHGHGCSCHRSLDELPPMTDEERKIFDILVEAGNALIEFEGKSVDLQKIIDEITKLLEEDALQGENEAVKALEMLADDEIAKELAESLGGGDIHVTEALSKRIRARAELLVNSYADEIKGKVEEVLNSGEALSANEIKERLAKIIPETRAELIARNETLYAIRSGRLEQDEALAAKYGLNIKLVWRTSGDDRVCAICEAMEGETIELGKAWPDTVKTADGEVIGWEHSSWNDAGRIPDAHPNCRCYFDEVLA